MDIFLQVWAGLFYLLQKILLSLSEGRKNERTYRATGWIAFLVGMPAWMIILSQKGDWIIVSIEFGGLPSVALGLYSTIKGVEKTPRWLDLMAKVCVYVFVVIGLTYSYHVFGGFNQMSQILELGAIAGILFGSYYLAQKSSRKRTVGWLWFALMNSSCGALMLMQGKPILALQQMASLGFVIYGFVKAIQKDRGGKR